MHTPLASTLATERDLAQHLEALLALEPAFVPVLERVGSVPLRPLGADFAGLARVIAGQQISVAAGRAVFGRLETALGTVTAQAVLAADDPTLRGAGLSASKANTLRGLATAIAEGTLDLLALQEGARLAFDLAERPKERDFYARADAWRPHRAVAARLLWAYYGAVKAGQNNALPV
jgi:DNA-3-methyladenine glycosylase II